MNHQRLQELVMRDGFPLSNKYDPQWVLGNQMDPNALWLTEWLCGDIDLDSGMRVLDLGCGRGLSSIFLAKEYGVHVWQPTCGSTPRTTSA
jgi:cyclopropane fatty-acyl-phospholipid synthase-like methyltransferase